MTKDNRFSGLLALIGGLILSQTEEDTPPKRDQRTLPYSISYSPSGRPIVTVNNYQISSIFDQPYFKQSLEIFPKWISESELEVAVRFEESVQRATKHLGPRKYSGLYPFSHIQRDVEEVIRMSVLANVPLDITILTGALGHDVVEDHPSMIDYNQKWQEALLSGNHGKRKSLESKISKYRKGIINDLKAELLGYIPDSLKSSERTKLETDLQMAVDLIHHLTRYSNQYIYAASMGFQYRRLPKDGSDEPLSQTLRRILVKNSDIISNMRERGPILEQETMRRMDMAFNDKTQVGEELRQIYGYVRPQPEYMPPAVRVGTAFNSIYPLHFSNQTFNTYEKGVFTDGDKSEDNDARTRELFRLARLSRNEMANTTLQLLESAIQLYEKFDAGIRKLKPEIDLDIEEKRKGTYFQRVTLGGPVGKMLLNEGGGSAYLKLLDFFEEKRIDIYKAARDAMIAFPQFLGFYNPLEVSSDGKKRMAYDQRKLDTTTHLHFTLDGLDDVIKQVPDYWGLVASMLRETKKVRARVEEAVPTSQLPEFIQLLHHT